MWVVSIPLKAPQLNRGDRRMNIRIRCPHCGTWINLMELENMPKEIRCAVRCHFCKWYTEMKVMGIEQ